jgi:hypothetical protein
VIQPPTQPSLLQKALVMIARLVGFLDRKGDGDSGPKGPLDWSPEDPRLFHRTLSIFYLLSLTSKTRYQTDAAACYEPSGSRIYRLGGTDGELLDVESGLNAEELRAELGHETR